MDIPSIPLQPSRRVLILAAAPAQLLDIAGPAEVLAQAAAHIARLGGGAAAYDVEVAIVPGASPVTTSAGVAIAAGRSLRELVAAERPFDTVIVAGGKGARIRHDEPALRDAVHSLAGRARRVVSVCTGAFVLAAAGLLDGRRVATHWRWCDLLARRFPAIAVEADPIFVRDGNVWTSAGISAGIDMTLALVEEDHGHALALAVARDLVMFLRRPGGQSQFSTTLADQTAADTDIRALVAWMADNLHRPLTVDMLAARTRFSPRQFARVFARELGMAPGAKLDQMRVDAARRALEDGQHNVAAVAAACGFGTEEAMRRAFLRHLGIPPGAYRDRFRRRPADSFSAKDMHP
jgi:transcriptional regulator GlxA family with amidase domain